MPEVGRRRFLQLAGGTTALSVLTPSIARAASIPAYRRAGSIEDVEHVVILITGREAGERPSEHQRPPARPLAIVRRREAGRNLFLSECVGMG